MAERPTDPRPDPLDHQPRSPDVPNVTGSAGAELRRYQEMRDFEETPEPAGFRNQRADQGANTFLVQKHRATRLHYDLRLEVDGVLKSFPVPRGPSTDPAERRLAVMTEDHPFDYGTFEGVIPTGQYGAGEVIVWDRGTYSPDEGGIFSFHDRTEANERMRRGIRDGKLSFHLRGEKMKGSWTLVRTARSPQSWLLIKHQDEAATAEDELTGLDRSVISGLTIADLQAGRWPPPSATPATLVPEDLPGARSGRLPADLIPMQAQAVRDPFSDDRWVFEPKLDGIRALAWMEDGRVTLRTRNGNEIGHQYPRIAAALGRQPAHRLVLDGEIATLDDRGLPSFERLQHRLHLQNEVEIAAAERTLPAVYYVFDMIELDGIDLSRVPLDERKRTLQQILLPSAEIQYVAPLDADGRTAYEAAAAIGLEGIVAKRRDSPYQPGHRSSAWLKIKPRLTGEFVVGGFTRGEGGRASTFGSLSLGLPGDGGLVPVGACGSGFSELQLRNLRDRMAPLITPESPFRFPPERAAETSYVRPELVVEVGYAQMTSEGRLRSPVFVRLRDDRTAESLERSPTQTPASILAGTGAPRAGLETDIADVERQLEAGASQLTLEVGAERLALTNLDKVMWPETPELRAIAKRDLVAYYARMAPLLLRQLRDRPLTMTRYPNGVGGEMFYQKHVPQRPSFVETVRVFSESGPAADYVLVNNLPTLLWLAQLADLALHTSLARTSTWPDGEHLGRDFQTSRETLLASTLNYPDFILFDLDPYIYAGGEARGAEPELNRRAFRATVQVARWLKELLDGANLPGFIKTSGATGLHIYVPVLRHYDYEAVRGLAGTIGGFLESQHPADVTTQWLSEQRRGKVFFDQNQNARIKNLACAYSPRDKPGAPVSTPLRWNELDRIYPTDFHILNVPDRVADEGDLWAHLLQDKHDLGSLLDATGAESGTAR